MMTSAGPRRIDSRAVSTWLFLMSALIALMVTVGGATRLTDSGLSIVEWRPLTGAIPPLSEAQWQEEFGKYRTIPEYQLVNRGMSLAEFKEIYWWEWGHRFLGRLLGVAFLGPLLYFILTRKVSGPLALKLCGLLLLGGAQGALGWWMVASGLSERTDVSQYRLAAHLSLALILFGLIFWTGLDVRTSGASAGRRLGARDRGPGSRRLALAALALAVLVFLQMALGAFVAGLRAGRVFNTWPLMDGRFIPAGYFDGAPGLNDLFETHAAVQFNHRIGAYVLLAAAIWFCLSTRKSALAGPARLLLIAVVLQGALGIWTVLAATPIALGLLHQAGALAVFAIALYAAHLGWAGLTVGGGANSGMSGSAAAAPGRYGAQAS